MKAIIIINIFLILFLVSCRNEQPNNRNEENPIEDHEEIPNSVFLTDEQIKAVGIQLGQIEQKSLSDGLKVNGEDRKSVVWEREQMAVDGAAEKETMCTRQ